MELISQLAFHRIQIANIFENIIEKKNVFKISLNCLRTNNESFLCLGTSKTLSLGDFDEYETHIILSPFFMHI